MPTNSVSINGTAERASATCCGWNLLTRPAEAIARFQIREIAEGFPCHRKLEFAIG
jgi:hypothetical protein